MFCSDLSGVLPGENDFCVTSMGQNAPNDQDSRPSLAEASSRIKYYRGSDERNYLQDGDLFLIWELLRDYRSEKAEIQDASSGYQQKAKAFSF